MELAPSSLCPSPDLLQLQLEGGSVAAGRFSPMPPGVIPNGGRDVGGASSLCLSHSEPCHLQAPEIVVQAKARLSWVSPAP